MFQNIRKSNELFLDRKNEGFLDEVHIKMLNGSRPFARKDHNQKDREIDAWIVQTRISKSNSQHQHIKPKYTFKAHFAVTFSDH